MKKTNIKKLREISTPAEEDWFEIEKKWENENNEDLRSFISVKFASNAKVIDGKRFALFTWETFKDVALELINCGKEKQKEQPTNEERLRTLRAEYEKGVADTIAKYEQKSVTLNESVGLGLDRALHIVKDAKGNLPAYQTDDGIYECESAIRALENLLKNDIEQKPAESEKERIRKRICLCLDECVHSDIIRDYERDECLAYLEKQKEHQPNIELIQRSWYLEGYNDRKFGKEPKWVIKTGEGGPEYEENPKYGQMLKEQNPAEWSEEDENKIEAIKFLIAMGFVDTNMIRTIIRELLDSLRPQPN